MPHEIIKRRVAFTAPHKTSPHSPRLIVCLQMARLLSRRPQSVHFLMREFEVSQRSIQRYLRLLSESGFPLVKCANNGWWQIKKREAK